MLANPKYSDGIQSVVQTTFGGFKKTDGARDGEIYDMLNMTSDSYPVLASRPVRSEYVGLKKIMEYFEDQTQRWWERQGMEGDYMQGFPHARPQLIGAYDVSDKIFFVVSALDFGSSDLEGQVFKAIYIAVYSGKVVVSDSIAPASSEYVRATAFNNKLILWVKDSMYDGDAIRCSFTTNEDTGAVQIELEHLGMSLINTSIHVFHDVSKATTYINIHTYETQKLRVGDTVSVTVEGAAYYVKILKLHIESGCAVIETYLKEDIPQSVDNLEALYATETDGLMTATVERSIPFLEHIAVNNDRIWGTIGNKIYCCASNDPFNWYDNDYDTVSRSFFAEIPTVSAFVGITSYMGNVFFFTKEDVYLMYGRTPDAFSLSSLAAIGCEANSGESFGVAAQSLFYNSTQGAACFNGETTTLISYPFGSNKLRNAIGCGHDTKYYLSDGKYIYVYDTQYGTWHKEEGAVVSMLVIDGRLVLFYKDGTAWYHEWDKNIDQNYHEEDVESEVEFADISEGSPYYINAGEITLRMWLDQTAHVALYACYDKEYGITDDMWELLWETYTEGKHSETVRFTPKQRCDHYRLKFVAKGNWKLYSMTRTYAVGSNTKYGG